MPMQMKHMITDTLFNMAKKKNIDKITVKDLVESCKISRQTFYYHFQDLFDVIEWGLEQAVQVAIDHSLAAESPQASLEEFVSMVIKNYDFMNCLLRSQRREQIEKLLIKGLRTYLREMIYHRAPQIVLSYADAEVMLDFCAMGVAGVLFTRCTDKGQDAKALAHQIDQLLSSVIQTQM